MNGAIEEPNGWRHLDHRTAATVAGLMVLDQETAEALHPDAAARPRANGVLAADAVGQHNGPVMRRLAWWGLVLAVQVTLGYWWWMAKTHGPVTGNCRHMDPEIVPFCLRSLRGQTPLEAVPVGQILLVWLGVNLALLALGIALAARRESRGRA